MAKPPLPPPPLPPYPWPPLPGTIPDVEVLAGAIHALAEAVELLAKAPTTLVLGVKGAKGAEDSRPGPMPIRSPIIPDPAPPTQIVNSAGKVLASLDLTDLEDRVRTLEQRLAPGNTWEGISDRVYALEANADEGRASGQEVARLLGRVIDLESTVGRYGLPEVPAVAAGQILAEGALYGGLEDAVAALDEEVRPMVLGQRGAQRKVVLGLVAVLGHMLPVADHDEGDGE